MSKSRRCDDGWCCHLSFWVIDNKSCAATPVTQLLVPVRLIWTFECNSNSKLSSVTHLGALFREPLRRFTMSTGRMNNKEEAPAQRMPGILFSVVFILDTS